MSLVVVAALATTASICLQMISSLNQSLSIGEADSLFNLQATDATHILRDDHACETSNLVRDGVQILASSANPAAYQKIPLSEISTLAADGSVRPLVKVGTDRSLRVDEIYLRQTTGPTGNNPNQRKALLTLTMLATDTNSGRSLTEDVAIVVTVDSSRRITSCWLRYPVKTPCSDRGLIYDPSYAAGGCRP